MCVPLQISVIWTGIYSLQNSSCQFLCKHFWCGTFIGRRGNQLYVLISVTYEYNLSPYCEELLHIQYF